MDANTIFRVATILQDWRDKRPGEWPAFGIALYDQWNRDIPALAKEARRQGVDNQPLLNLSQCKGDAKEVIARSLCVIDRIAAVDEATLPAELDLTKTERRLLEYLWDKRRASYDDVADCVWQKDVSDDGIQRAVTRLNKKLLEQPFSISRADRHLVLVLRR